MVRQSIGQGYVGLLGLLMRWDIAARHSNDSGEEDPSMAIAACIRMLVKGDDAAAGLNLMSVMGWGRVQQQQSESDSDCPIHTPRHKPQHNAWAGRKDLWDASRLLLPTHPTQLWV